MVTTEPGGTVTAPSSNNIDTVSAVAREPPWRQDVQIRGDGARQFIHQARPHDEERR
jgi:hypothetical protein